MTDDESARNAARAGALYLDEHVPGWWERVDTKRLDLGNCRVCVLGQLCGHEGLGDFAFGHMADLLGLTPEQEEDLGFRGGPRKNHAWCYAALTEAWKGEIEERRAEDFVDRLKHAFSDLPPIRLEDAPWNWEIPA